LNPQSLIHRLAEVFLNFAGRCHTRKLSPTGSAVNLLGPFLMRIFKSGPTPAPDDASSAVPVKLAFLSSVGVEYP
jgi:hypothetical protein